MSRRQSEDASSSSDSELDVQEDSDGWEDAEPDVESIEVKDFFSSATFPAAKLMIEHCRTTHGFDFLKTQKQFGLDFLETAKLVNYIRKEALAGHKPTEIASKDIFSGDEYLQPTLEDDALLFSLDELIDDAELSQKSVDQNDTDDSPEALKQRLTLLQEQFAQYRTDVEQTLDKRWNSASDEIASRSSGKAPSRSAEDELLDQKYDQGYFDSYSYNDIHQTMLQDSIRTDAYRDFIYGNKHLFAGKTVLDVGCGTGILSMFCAKAGAAKVIAVDNSAIIDKTRAIIFENKLDGVITCVKGKIEEISLPVDKVDIIVSEWMGYCLLFEAMLDSVLYARDKYLKPDGLMVPSHCTLHLGALADPDYVADNFSFWQDVYGFDMTAMTEKIYDEVIVRSTDASAIAGRTGPEGPFKLLDLHTITTKDLDFTASFKLKLNAKIDRLDGFSIWFDTIFMAGRDRTVPQDLLQGARSGKTVTQGDVFFSTGPFTKTTHWQTGLCMTDSTKGKTESLEKGQEIQGSIVFEKNKVEKRALNIDITWGVAASSAGGQQRWHMR